MYWAECAIFSVLSLLLMIICEKPVWIFPMYILIFAIVNLLLQMHLHKTWANDRIRIFHLDNSD